MSPRHDDIPAHDYSTYCKIDILGLVSSRCKPASHKHLRRCSGFSTKCIHVYVYDYDVITVQEVVTVVLLRDDVIILLEKLYETSILILADQTVMIIGIRSTSILTLGFGSLVAGVRVEEKRTLYLSDFDVAPLLSSQNPLKSTYLSSDVYLLMWLASSTPILLYCTKSYQTSSICE